MILDATCSGRMIWENKSHSETIYVDRRISPPGSVPCRPNWEAKPNVVADFTALPFADEAFSLVVFDPPHLKRLNAGGITFMKYGQLGPNWADVLRGGFAECMRVLRRGGCLAFKWAENDISNDECFRLFGERPLWRSDSRFHLFYKAAQSIPPCDLERMGAA